MRGEGDHDGLEACVTALSRLGENGAHICGGGLGDPNLSDENLAGHVH